MASKEDLNPETFHFRGLHPNIFLGTASDRYVGWIGQIYSADRYSNRITSRSHKVGGKSFKEEVLPVESVEEYFTHFRVLEIDYTFYQFLLDDKGQPTRTLHVLDRYQSHLDAEDSVLLKVPQSISAQKLRRGSVMVPNEAYLDPHRFTAQFYEPSQRILGSNLKGFIFEQEYQRKGERRPPGEVAEALDRFFEAVPRDDRYQIELRTEAYLTSPVFDVLETHGVGQVLSHWTWLPPLEKQFARAAHRFFNAGKRSVIRLMTPIGVRYEEAYALAHPCDRLVEGLLQPGMVNDTVGLMKEGIRQNVQVHVIVNNRAGGNAPSIVQQIAGQFVASFDKKGSALR